ncbi:K(+)-transporting ATPase subunit C [Pseudonocardia sp. NPDC049154]|uniref:K(+)-transporting ATPase subunit C n=1 Tax=Pseudonocardia sp. NPDC049154 TaxID=3155501 RepID=UPI0033C385FC
MLSTLRRQTGTGLRLLIVLTVLCGIAYPLAVWGVSRLPGLSGHAEGSLITQDGTAVGSSLIGVDPVPTDPAADPYFHTRPSASAEGVLGPADTTTSGGSNKAGNSAELLDTVSQRRALIAQREGVAPEAVPTDAVTASGSGLDPDISPAYAALQVDRVARVTGLPADRVRDLVARATDGRILGFLGEPTVNVTELNLAVAAAQRPGG